MANRIAFWMKNPRRLISTIQETAIPIGRLETVELMILFALCLSCTIPYTVLAGSFTISTAEIFAWLFILWRWTVGGAETAKLDRGIRWLIRGFRIFAIWAGILWLSSGDWIDRRGMFVRWVLAALLFECLLRRPWNHWKRLAAVFVWAALPVVIWGVLQHVMGVGLAPKDLSGWGRNASSFPITGFFGHSNDLAVYLYWPLLVSAGLASSFRSWRRVIFILLTLLYSLVMYWTISRSTLLAIIFVAVLTVLVVLIRRRRIFLVAVIAGAILTALAIAWVFLTIPLDRINHTLSGRLDLWNQGLQLILSDKFLLPFGYNLSASSGNPSIWWLPHNIYTLFWLEYGWPGILVLIGLAIYFLYSGWKRYDSLRSHFPTAVLWTGMVGLFLINGMGSLYFHETYVVITFLCVTAVWAAQIIEIDFPLATGTGSAKPGVWETAPAGGFPSGYGSRPSASPPFHPSPKADR